MSSLYNELVNDQRLQALLPERNDVLITDTFNVGRVKLVPTKIGELKILATLGLEAGNALLDELYSNPLFRYVKTSLQTGNLDVSHPLVRGTLDNLVASNVIALEHAEALKALALQPDPVTIAQVSEALNLGI